MIESKREKEAYNSFLDLKLLIKNSTMEDKEIIIYVAHYESEPLCAFTDEERAKIDCEESGVNYDKITLHIGKS